MSAPAGTIATTCPYCGVGCGVLARPDGTIAGDPAHPSNRGRLCSKGAALGKTLDDTERLLVPRIDGHHVGLDMALDHVAACFAETIAKHGPDSVAFYVSGQFLTEDYYVANKLMKGFIGSGNIDTNSRLCMASSVAGHVRAFGEDVVPGVYEDWEQADLVVLVGANAAWCHPVLHQRLTAARAARGTRVVVIDPRRTATAEAADLHLPLAIGTDIALFNGLLVHLHDRGATDRAWVAAHAAGLADALAVARADARDTETTAALCGVDPETVETFFDWFAATERVLTVWSQGVNQSDAGTDKVNAIINCHLATGRIGRPGMGPFSVTGQPNAMGGREVGGMANQLAAHLGFDDLSGWDAVRRFWRAPALARRPGLKAVELFEAVAAGKIRALWIAATNPAVSMPRAGAVRAGLAACPFLVVSDCWETDTTRLARVVLPAAGWGEKDGTVTSSERRISRQRRFRAPPGDARPDWWMFAEVGRRLGWAEHFAWEGPAAIFREHAALSAFENDGRRVFDLGALACLDRTGYDALRPVAWPLPSGERGEAGRLFAAGGFPTRDRRARMIPTPYRGRPRAPLDAAASGVVLNTGRVRDQWHTMTRTGRVAALIAHTPEPRLALHPADAARLGIAEDTLVRVTAAAGEVVLRASLTYAQRRGEAFAPIHWTDDFAASGPVARVVAASCDPLSGQPALKATPVRLAPLPALYAGLLLRRRRGPMPAAPCHWVRMPMDAGDLTRLTGIAPVGIAPAGIALVGITPADIVPAGIVPAGIATAGIAPAEAAAVAAVLLPIEANAEQLELHDAARFTLRRALLRDGRLEACLFLARTAAALPRAEALLPLLGTVLTPAQRGLLLSGRSPGTEAAPDGPCVCACFGVTRDAVRHAVATHRLSDAAAIGACLGAGTNCGSCIPELEEILRDLRLPAI
ncbi:MAG: molybdopterin-dependent oxidoreductase [Acetobacteraceae bacterium]